MITTEFDAFVRRTDQYAERLIDERKSIARYGLIGEIGSLISAVKKKILAEGGKFEWHQPNDEIKEEIGDLLWYCFSLAQACNEGGFDILANDIALLSKEVGGGNERAETIGRALAALDPKSKEEFLSIAATFPPRENYTFDDYQALAFKTARTDGLILLEVCLAVLSQLGAELLRPTLPEIERTLNKNIADRPTNVVLGEITWHLAAIASLYHLSLNEIVAHNREKVSFRSERMEPTAFPDEGRPESEQFPRLFDVVFVRLAKGRSRMYFEGKRLGDDLTDNANEDDGYRFHDVLHLAFIAHLGWSPVVRGMMKRKRPNVDEVQDGGRAKVVEELAIKAIHSEGESQAKAAGRCAASGPIRLFPERGSLTFRLLKTLRSWVEGLEVWNNKYWEWEDAILDGCDVFFKLREHGQGVVQVDMQKRQLTFSPYAAPNVSGVTVGVGIAAASHGDKESQEILSQTELVWAEKKERVVETCAAKRALFSALGIERPTAAEWSEIQLHLLDGNLLSVAATGTAQKHIWKLQAVDFKIAFSSLADSTLCTVNIVADITDFKVEPKKSAD